MLNHVLRLERDNVGAVHADIREPEDVLGAPAMEIIDFARPVGLLLVAVTRFIAAPHDPYEIMRACRDAVPSGSLVLSHVTGDGQAPQPIRRGEEAWSGTPTGVHLRSRR